MSAYVPGFLSFSCFLYHYVLVKLATISIRVKDGSVSVVSYVYVYVICLNELVYSQSNIAPSACCSKIQFFMCAHISIVYVYRNRISVRNIQIRIH